VKPIDPKAAKLRATAISELISQMELEELDKYKSRRKKKKELEEESATEEELEEAE
jgi:hypothetical protein